MARSSLRQEELRLERERRRLDARAERQRAAGVQKILLASARFDREVEKRWTKHRQEVRKIAAQHGIDTLWAEREDEELPVEVRYTGGSWRGRVGAGEGDTLANVSRRILRAWSLLTARGYDSKPARWLAITDSGEVIG